MIDWKDKIRNNDAEIDLSDHTLYVPNWNSNNYVDVYGYKVLLPVPPPDNECINYGLDENNQIYRRSYLPPDLEHWDLNKKEIYIEQQFHHRKHGLWYLIKGKKIYISGTFHFFLCWWHLETGDKPFFRMSDLDFFHLWMHVVRSPKIYGLVIFKCRRVGDTEKSICIVYEYASRVRNTLNAMQDCRKEDDIEKTYARLIYAHQRMVWFMKPINKGTSDPKEKLEFKYPEEKQTLNKIQKKNLGREEEVIQFEYPALNSIVDYYVSTPEATDGKRHGRYYCDEFGKPKKLNPIEGWRYTKKTLVDEIKEEISGKAIYTSTVEEETGVKAKDSSKFMQIAEDMYDMCDPNNLNESGETTSGMIRVVRGALERGKPDRWGFTDKDRLKKKIESDKKHLIEQRKWKQLAEYTRQNCVDIQDVFMSMSGESNFNVENLTQRDFRLKYEIRPTKAVRGNFHWVDNKKFGDVYFQPNESGRWLVSGHPKDWGLRANAKSTFSLNPKPKNIHAFCMGIDPVSQKDTVETEEKRSKAGLVVKRKYDPAFDGNEKFDDEGNPLFGGEHFSTNRYVCTYIYRWEEPTKNYEDWLMTMIYYGTDFLIEKNHSAGFLTYLELTKFIGYYMDNTNGVKNYKGVAESLGQTASEKTIESYFSLLTTISNLWHNTIDHIDLIDQLKSGNYENRGKKDLMVASGFCEIAAQREISAPKDRALENTNHFTEIYV